MNKNKLKIIIECRKTKKNQQAQEFIDTVIYELAAMLKKEAGVTLSPFELIAIGLAMEYEDAARMIAQSKNNKKEGGSFDA